MPSQNSESMPGWPVAARALVVPIWVLSMGGAGVVWGIEASIVPETT